MAWIKASANCWGYDEDGIYCSKGLTPVNWDELGFPYKWETYWSNQPPVIEFDDKFKEMTSVFLDKLPPCLIVIDGRVRSYYL
jgi:hypothetical protein